MSTDPSDILSQRPQGPTREQTEKTVHDKFPGHIAWATDRANFAGCRAVRFYVGGWTGLEKNDEAKFLEQVEKMIQDHYASLNNPDPEDDTEYTPSAEELMNLYFSTRANLLVVQMGYDGTGGIAAFITTQLDEEDLEDFEAARQAQQVAMREQRAKRAERYEAQRQAILEEKRLAAIGRRYEENLKNNLPKNMEKELA